MIVLLFFIGFLIGLMAFGYRVLILSDIPVSYTTSEAVTAQISFFIASAMLLIALVSLKNRIGLGITAIIFTFSFLFNIQVIPSMVQGTNSNSSIVQLELAPVLHLGLLLLVNVYLLIQNWKQKLVLK
ncbi:hypothetical protein [Aquibacillus kalidii]|uniref:hypothetical protein n=1 Tax=Aquibacillus kalidii TaxID=2762597 RepID=UPI001C99617A|nr:hypothetical protein [Aquibacillus kalidii]